MPDNLRSIVVDGLTVSTTDQGAQAIEKLQKQLSDAETESKKEKETKDGEIAALTKQVETKDGEIAALTKQVEDATSPKAMADAVRARAEVLDAGRAAGITDTESMTDAQIRRAVVKKALGDAADSMSDDAISGAFVVTSRQGTRDGLSAGVTPPQTVTGDADKAYTENLNHLRDAWKSKEAS